MATGRKSATSPSAARAIEGSLLLGLLSDERERVIRRAFAAHLG